MNTEKLIDSILNDLSELNLLAEDLKTSDSLELDIDIAVSKAKMVTREFQLLKEQMRSSALLGKKAGWAGADSNESSSFIPEEPEMEIVQGEEIMPDAAFEIEEEPDVDFPEEEKFKVDAAFLEIDEEEMPDEEEPLEEEVEEEEEEETEEMPDEEEEEEPIEEETPEEETEEVEEEIEEEEVSEEEEEETADEPEEEEDEEEEAEEDTKTIGENYQQTKSVNDTIAENQTLEQKFANESINSLQHSISINDQFLFIREIFNNDAEKYNETIQRLDNMGSIKEAADYLSMNFKIKKTETSLKFVELIKRRFA